MSPDSDVYISHVKRIKYWCFAFVASKKIACETYESEIVTYLIIAGETS